MAGPDQSDIAHQVIFISMENLKPNTIVHDRFLLNELLSSDEKTGEKTWSLTDLHTAEHFIAVFQADGKTQWFTDRRYPWDLEGNPEVKKTLPIYKMYSTTKLQTGIKRYGKPLGGILVLSILAAILIGKPYENLSNLFPATKKVPLSNQSLKTTDLAVGSKHNKDPRQPSDESYQILIAMPPVSQQKSISAFAQARRTFTDLSYRDPKNNLVNDAFKLCLRKGEQALDIYNKSTDTLARYYALEWFQTAMSLKTTEALEIKIRQLKDHPYPVKKHLPAKPKNKNEYFLRT